MTTNTWLVLMGSAWVVNTVVVVLHSMEFARCRKLLHESQVEAGRRGRQSNLSWTT